MYFDLYWFNGEEYFTEYSSGIVYPYISILKSKLSFFVCLLFIFFIYLSIIVIVSLLLLFTIIFTFNVYMYIYIYIFLHILFKYASKVRATYIIIPENNGSKAPIQLSGRGRSCLAFVRSGMFGLGTAPKEKLSRLFDIVSIQK